MKLDIRAIQTTDGAEAARVELDLCDGRKLFSAPMSFDDARDLRAELERRIFEIGEGVRNGRRDRM